MNKKNLIIAVALLIFSLIFAILSISGLQMSNGNDLSGQLVFAQTSNQGAHLDKVIITTSQSTSTIELKDGYWRVIEGNNYYAGMALTNSMFMAMNTIRYFTPIDTQGKDMSEYFLNFPKKDDEHSGILIQTFANNKILDEIILGGTTADNTYRFIRKPNDNNVWIINNDLTIPQKTYSWFQQPLLNYTTNQIRMYRTTIDGNKIEYKRHRPADNFVSKDNRNESLNILSEVFNYMTFSNVVPSSDFPKDQYPHKRNIEITLFNGLVTSMDVYTNDEQKEYWTEVKIYANRLPTMGVNDYIKNNDFLYNGWTFQLLPEIGNILYKTFENKK